MRAALHWPPAVLLALLSAVPPAAIAAEGAPAPTGAATPAKALTAPTAAKPATPAAAAKPAGTAPTAAKPAGTAPTAAKPAGTTPATVKPAGPAPAAGTAKPATPAQPAAPVTAPGAMSADPAKDHLPLAQATFGIKGVGALFTTIEIAEVGKPVQALHCELYTDKAPLAVANFVGLARGLRPWKDPKLGQWVRRPLYDGNVLHRVIPELLIQGGDPNCTMDASCRGAPGIGEPGYSIPDEIRPELRFDHAGRLAMANRGLGTSGSQFFITEREATWLNGSHTIFGQCDGAELVTQLSHVETGSRDQPKSPLTIKRITFLRKPK